MNVTTSLIRTHDRIDRSQRDYSFTLQTPQSLYVAQKAQIDQSLGNEHHVWHHCKETVDVDVRFYQLCKIDAVCDVIAEERTKKRGVLAMAEG